MKFIEQCKGKDLDNVPASKLLQNGWILTRKYDGNYVQIHKVGKEVKFYTSGNKEFFIPEVANELVTLNPYDSFILECEYIGTSEGMLGDRTKACKLTTYRTNFEKGLSTKFDSRERFKCFDIILPSIPFIERVQLMEMINYGNYIDNATNIFTSPESLDYCKLMASNMCRDGWEGAYIKQARHLQEAGKRVNTAIKLKYRKTIDLKCIDIIDGIGKYIGQIGSLVLKDSKGRVVAVGSGLNDNDRQKDKGYYIGKIIEIEYEQIIDTYIQPTFIRIRDDKEDED